MEYVLLGISSIFTIVSIVCTIIVIVKMFQNNQTGLGILTVILFFCGIGQIVALIAGWMNKDPLKLQKVMPIFTASFVLSIILGGAGYAILAPKIVNQMQKQMQSIEQEMQQKQQDLQQQMQQDMMKPMPK